MTYGMPPPLLPTPPATTHSQHRHDYLFPRYPLGFLHAGHRVPRPVHAPAPFHLMRGDLLSRPIHATQDRQRRPPKTNRDHGHTYQKPAPVRFHVHRLRGCASSLSLGHSLCLAASRDPFLSLPPSPPPSRVLFHPSPLLWHPSFPSLSRSSLSRCSPSRTPAMSSRSRRSK